MSTKDFPEGINITNGTKGGSLTPGKNVIITDVPVMWQPSGVSLAAGGTDVSQTGNFTVRTRVTLAEMNAGKTLLGAYAGAKWKISDVKVIAIGGAAAATADATGVAVYGTKAGTVTALYTALLAALTENAVCQINTADTSVATAGALFAANDVKTAITCKAVSAGAFDLITATHFDVILTVCLEV